MLRNADGGGGVKFSGKKRYEGVKFNVISVTRGRVGVQFPDKKRYVTREWPLTAVTIYGWVIGNHACRIGERGTNILVTLSLSLNF